MTREQGTNDPMDVDLAASIVRPACVRLVLISFKRRSTGKLCQMFLSTTRATCSTGFEVAEMGKFSSWRVPKRILSRPSRPHCDPTPCVNSHLQQKVPDLTDRGANVAL